MKKPIGALFALILALWGAMTLQLPGFEWGYDRLDRFARLSPSLVPAVPPRITSPNGKQTLYPVYAPSPTRYKTPYLDFLLLEPGEQAIDLKEEATQVFASPVGMPREPLMNMSATPPAPYEFTQIHWLRDSSGWVLLRQRLQPQLSPPEFRVYHHAPLPHTSTLALPTLAGTFVWEGILPNGCFVFAEGYYPYNLDKRAERKRDIVLWHPGSSVGAVRYTIYPPHDRPGSTLAEVQVEPGGKSVLACVNLPRGRTELWQLPFGPRKGECLFAPDGHFSVVCWSLDGHTGELDYQPHCTLRGSEPAGRYLYRLP